MHMAVELSGIAEQLFGITLHLIAKLDTHSSKYEITAYSSASNYQQFTSADPATRTRLAAKIDLSPTIRQPFAEVPLPFSPIFFLITSSTITFTLFLQALPAALLSPSSVPSFWPSLVVASSANNTVSKMA
eukprot:GEZU01029922.1.p1 GENE.GEZU01029922.1~~GEZU01029922.1.p1  ORF type:complete len:131 (-),score=2.67 GEZU01029922.1:232-624(-)